MSISVSSSLTLTQCFWRRGFFWKYKDKTEFLILNLIKNGPVVKRGKRMKFYKRMVTRTTGMSSFSSGEVKIFIHLSVAEISSMKHPCTNFLGFDQCEHELVVLCYTVNLIGAFYRQFAIKVSQILITNIVLKNKTFNNICYMQIKSTV